jgi:insertion element IS1 protein InsB
MKWMKCTPISVQKNSCWIWIAVDIYGNRRSALKKIINVFVLPVSDTIAGAKRFLNFVTGDRSNKTAKKFWKTIKHHEMKYIASDYWKPYESIIPKESKIDGAQRSPLFTIDGSEPTERIRHDCRSQKYIRTKAETFTVEGYNSLVRHFLARMKKKV